MKRFLVVADRHGEEQRAVAWATDLAARMRAELVVVGFVYEHLGNLPLPMTDGAIRRVQDSIVKAHRAEIQRTLEQKASKTVKGTVEVHWAKRVADWVNRSVQEEDYDLVIKSGHRSETFLYTPTDWQLLRGCRVPVLLVASTRWTKATHVLAAVDLGTSVRSKRVLNYKIVEEADAFAKALGCELHVGYAVPFSAVMRDLDLLDKSKLLAEGRRLARSFQSSLAERGIDIRAIHVRAGPPEKVLVSMAAKHWIGLVVLGCVGRRSLAGRVVGNTAEQILRLLKADILALKP